MSLYVGVNGTPKKLKSLFVGVNGDAKEVKNSYAGNDEGVNKVYTKELVVDEEVISTNDIIFNIEVPEKLKNVVDNFERALILDDEAFKSYLDGFKLIYNQIVNIFVINYLKFQEEIR